MGINDIGWANTHLSTPMEVLPTAEDIYFAYQKIVERLHTHNIRVLAGTLLSFENALLTDPPDYYTDEKELNRQQLNHFIRTSCIFDAIIDFDNLMQNRLSPTQLKPEFDSGDCLHPNDLGYEAMANAINLLDFLDTD